jgi:hypothetical protein
MKFSLFPDFGLTRKVAVIVSREAGSAGGKQVCASPPQFPQRRHPRKWMRRFYEESRIIVGKEECSGCGWLPNTVIREL